MATKFALMIALTLAGVGCRSTLHLQDEIATRMLAADYSGALQIVEGNRRGAYGGKNRLLYYFEKGMLLHLDGRFVESNVAFERAKRIGDELYTRSVSEIGFSMFTNDNVQAYAGENFERTLLHLFAALNYASLGERDAALVEVRQVGDYLRKLQVDSTNENSYQDDAFARYLSALLYEVGGEYDSALVDFKKAAQLYGGRYAFDYSVAQPASLLPDAHRVARRLGAWAENDLREIDPNGFARILPAGAGEVVILHYNGLFPIKSQDRFTIPFIEAWPYVLALQAVADADVRAQIAAGTAVSGIWSGIDVISVVFPRFVDRPYSIATMAARSRAAFEVTPAELVEDIGAIAEKDLADRIVRIRAKAIARAALKYAVQKAIEQALGQALGQADDEYRVALQHLTQIGGGLARFASEQADKRIWSTLPDQIWMSYVVLPEGSHDIEIDFMNVAQNVVESRVIPGVQVTPGSRRFVIVRTVQ